MYRILHFGEDNGHRAVVTALVRKIAKNFSVDVQIKSFRSPSRTAAGKGRMLNDLSEFVKDLKGYGEDLPDLVVVAVDANCKGHHARRTEVLEKVGDFQEIVEIAIPNPHIERWLLLDPAAFAKVAGGPCPQPDLKCERDRYKALLRDAFVHAGFETPPPFGGIEFADDIVANFDLEKLATADESLGKFIAALQQRFRRAAHGS